MKPLLTLTLLVISSSGCVAVQDYWYGTTKRCDASLAWHFGSTIPEKVNNRSDYKCGWKAGYTDVAMGKHGCPPAVPPQCYWWPHYQTANGQAKIQDWYRGFQDGATAAETRGAGRWHYIHAAPPPVMVATSPSAALYRHPPVDHGVVGPTSTVIEDAEQGEIVPTPIIPGTENKFGQTHQSQRDVAPTYLLRRLPPVNDSNGGAETIERLPDIESEAAVEIPSMPSEIGLGQMSDPRSPYDTPTLERLPPVQPISYLQSPIGRLHSPTIIRR